MKLPSIITIITIVALSLSTLPLAAQEQSDAPKVIGLLMYGM